MWRRLKLLISDRRELSEVAAALARDAPTALAAFRSLLAMAALIARRLPASPSRRALPVYVRVASQPRRFLVTDLSELRAVHEVIGSSQYALPPEVAPPPTIIDLGSNVGASIVAFKAAYPDAVVHGYEPDPRTFEILRLNVAGLPDVHVHLAAAAGHDGVGQLTLSSSSWASSLKMRWQDTDPLTQVRTFRLSSILDRHGLAHADVVKLDVEGSELDVLEAFPDAHQRVGLLLGELHVGLPGMENAEPRLRACLTDYDVRVRREGMDTMFIAS